MCKATHVLSMNSPVGRLTLVEQEEALTELRFGEPRPEETMQETSLLLDAIRQLEEYFAGSRKCFDLPLAPKETPFQQRCWQALLDIPYGHTCTYAQQAQAIGNSKACRAVGRANHFNPIPLIIPCHRVIGAKGKLTGYAGGMEIKQKLLLLEGIDMERMKP